MLFCIATMDHRLCCGFVRRFFGLGVCTSSLLSKREDGCNIRKRVGVSAWVVRSMPSCEDRSDEAQISEFKQGAKHVSTEKKRKTFFAFEVCTKNKVRLGVCTHSDHSPVLPGMVSLSDEGLGPCSLNLAVSSRTSQVSSSAKSRIQSMLAAVASPSDPLTG